MKLHSYYTDKDTFICSYIGTIGMAHDLDVILKAAKYLKQVSSDSKVLFLIVGDGACKAALEQEAKEADLTAIRFMGLVPKKEIPNIIAVSDASLIHLKKNTLFTTVIPSKLFELMAMDVPIIMGVEGEARNIVLEAHAGELMEPGNEQDLLKAIARIQKNGRNYYHGRNYMIQHYDRNKLAQDMLDIIISVDKKINHISNHKN